MVRECRHLQLTARSGAKKDRVRKPLEINAPNAAGLNHLPSMRPLDGMLYGAFKFRDQACAKAGALILIKANGL
jgi:hypothetical protein